MGANQRTASPTPIRLLNAARINKKNSRQTPTCNKDIQAREQELTRQDYGLNEARCNDYRGTVGGDIADVAGLLAATSCCPTGCGVLHTAAKDKSKSGT